jgi:hypothetical protein
MKYKLINAIVDRNDKLSELKDEEEVAFVKSQLEYLNSLLDKELKRSD